MLRPATLVADDLQTSAVWRRKVEHLESTALEELELGFVEGPFLSEGEVSAYLGREDWSVIRRFVLVQGAEMKLRPSDDCLEAQLNQAYSVTSYLKLQVLGLHCRFGTLHCRAPCLIIRWTGCGTLAWEVLGSQQGL